MPRPRWTFLLQPRWLCWHVFAVLAAAGMIWLGLWQLRRAESGNELSWAYTFEWPLFAVFGIYFWVRSIREELRQAAARRTRRARRPSGRPSRPMPTRPGCGPRCAATASGTAWADPP